MVRVAAGADEQSTAVKVPLRNRIGPLSSAEGCGVAVIVAVAVGGEAGVPTSDCAGAAMATLGACTAAACCALLTSARRARLNRAEAAIPASLLFFSRSRIADAWSQSWAFRQASARLEMYISLRGLMRMAVLRCCMDSANWPFRISATPSRL